MSRMTPKLKAIREDKLWTQKKLAEESDVTVRTISAGERGEGLSFGSIKKLARALKVKPEALI